MTKKLHQWKEGEQGTCMHCGQIIICTGPREESNDPGFVHSNGMHLCAKSKPKTGAFPGSE